MVVLTDEPTSLTDAYAFIKLVTARENAPQVQLVINQAQSQKEGEHTYATINRACTNFLEILAAAAHGVIRKDNKVKDSIRSQSSLLTKAPHTTAATDAASISIKLMKKRIGTRRWSNNSQHRRSTRSSAFNR